MNLFFRVMLAIYAFCLTVASLILIGFTFRPDLLQITTDYIIKDVIGNKTSSMILFAIELIFFFLSIMFLMSGFKSDRDKKAVVRHTNIGAIRISLGTIENIALGASRKSIGIRESKAHVKKWGDSVTVSIKAVVMPDINIPLLLEDVQVRVKRSIEETTGVKVTDVNASVENVYSGYKSRVE